MFGRLDILTFDQQLFVEFFTRSETYELDLDITSRFESRQANHVCRKIGDADGLAHVEMKDIATIAVGG